MNDMIRTEIAWESQLGGQTVRHEDVFWYPKSASLAEIESMGGELAAALAGGGRTEKRLEPGELLPAHAPALALTLPQARFRTDFAKESLKRDLAPRIGRFYPRQMLLARGGDDLPPAWTFRLAEMSGGGTIRADFNHPLSGRPLSFRLHAPDGPSEFEIPPRHEEEALAWGFAAERPQTAFKLVDGLLRGPGMQAEMPGAPTDFFEPDSFEREQEAPDAEFYKAARMVSHVDVRASGIIQEFYDRVLPKPSGESKPRLLDLMAGFVSHLPPDWAERFSERTGLGMNAQEMRANRALSAHVVHDVNENPVLPFADASFEAVICSLSVDYLTRPVELFRDVFRALAPGGIFALTFSNRWFPPKVVRLWTQLSEFERQGFVLRCFGDAGGFADMQTCSCRGLPRPAGDRLGAELKNSDPVWGVCAMKPLKN